MPLTSEYLRKIQNYSRMQYGSMKNIDFFWNDKGAEFFNMGMMVMNKSITKYIKGSAREFLERAEFQDFVDGLGPWKWSTDQTLLNTWVKKYKIPTKNLNWKWNGLYKGIEDPLIDACHFVHFFLRDKLPNRGEDIERLSNEINRA